jgi:diphosphomevalonate decarboxylase
MFEDEQKLSMNLWNNPEGVTEWSSPSNIALVKYWGKRSYQLPENPNISFSLEKSRTITRVNYKINKEGGFKWKFLFEGKPAPEFEPKLNTFFNRLVDYLPYLSYLELDIYSENTFPHSTGIASSASAMSALSLCLLDIAKGTGRNEKYDKNFFRKASFISRIGSGSASRSVFPGFSIWGASDYLEESSDDYATGLSLDKTSFFMGLKDAIHIVSSLKKDVSSSIGHDLMKTNPYATMRYQHARENLQILIHAILNEDKNDFIRITENEALTLHGLMMSSEPGYVLIKNGTIEIINRIRSFRQSTGNFITFTLDAGPNVHVIYHEKDERKVASFINDELKKFTENGRIIRDGIGTGPQKLLQLS